MPHTETIQVAHLSQASGVSLDVTFASQPIIGNTILVVARDAAGGNLSCADNQGNTYSTDYSPDSGRRNFSTTVATTGTPFTVTVTSDGNTHHVYIVEVEGINRTVGVTQANSGVGGTVTTGTSAATSADVEYVFAFAFTSTSGVSMVPSVGIDLGPETGISRSSDASYRITSSPGTQSETWSGSVGAWSAWLLTYPASLEQNPTFQMSSAQ